jgi:cation diffusion facilitator family transporter
MDASMARWLRHVPRPELFAAAASVGVSLVLLVVKFVAYHLTGSAAIFSDALEQIVNVLASAFAAYSLLLAHQPADETHPYGHGKIEFMSAGFEGGMILLAALLILGRAIEEMVEGPGVHKLDAGLVLIFVAGGVNALVGLSLVRAGQRTGSVALVADGHHLLTDAITSAAVLIALLIMWFKPHWTWADPIAAVIVAIYITWTAVHLLLHSAAGLMDKQDVADEAMLRRILDSHLAPAGKQPHICSYHKLRHRHSGRYHWVDFHIMLPAQWSIAHGHEVASSIEYEIEQAIGEGNATAHVEPCVDAACAACAKKEAEMKANERG